MSFLDSAIDFFKDALEGVGDTVESWSQEWQNAVDNFKAKAKQFVSSYENLSSKKAVAEANPNIADDYNSLMGRGSWIYNMVASVARKIDFIGSSESTLNGMGALPLIPIAVIVGAVAAMTAWLSDAYIMTQKINAIEAAQSSGKDTAPLENVIGGGNSLIDIKAAPVSSLILLGGLGLIIYLVWPSVKAKLN